MPRALVGAGCSLAVLILAQGHACADPPTTEVSGGGEIARHGWSAYTTTTVALSGWLAGVPKSIREDGWRLRVGAGYWKAERRQTVWITDRGDQSEGGERRVRRLRTGSFADVLLGYQAQFGALTLKGFAGAVYANERYRLDGADEDSPGTLIGARVLLESWYNFHADAFLQVDASWTSEPNEWGGRVRAGYRLTPRLSIGPEVLHWRSDRGTTMPIPEVCRTGCSPYERRSRLTRYGGFMRYEWPAGELSLSGGTMDGAGSDPFYATFNVLLRF